MVCFSERLPGTPCKITVSAIPIREVLGVESWEDMGEGRRGVKETSGPTYALVRSSSESPTCRPPNPTPTGVVSPTQFLRDTELSEIG